MSSREDTEKLIEINNQHLQILKQQQATYGLQCPPHIITSIEHTEAEIAKLNAQLGQGDTPPEGQSNLPRQPFFFGREDELADIADALDPDSRGWGVLIDGPGGIGKTALAVKAGHDALMEQFPRKIFLSAKVRELTPAGEQPLEDFILPNYMALLTELGRELGDETIGKTDPAQRPQIVRDLLAHQRALLIIDNLETFDPKERRRLYQFLSRLPLSCKAIVTSRRRTDIDARIIRLDRLSKETALQLIEELTKSNPRLARTSPAEREELYSLTNGNPLLIRWLASQLGRPGSQCRTVTDTHRFMEAAPPDNEPLEYVFGDLLDTFTEDETKVLAALTHFKRPAEARWIADVSDLPQPIAQTALEDLSDRALLVTDAEERTFFLPPIAASFLRRKRFQIVTECATRLTDNVYVVVLENGYETYAHYPTLEVEWPAIAAALPLFVQGDNARLQRVCDALDGFLNFSGRWDEWLNLSLEAEQKALVVADFDGAGKRAFQAGQVARTSGQFANVLACAERAGNHWQQAKTGARGQALAIQLRGYGYQLKKDYPAAIAACRESLELRRSLSPESKDIAIGLNSLAEVERRSGDYEAAERNYREALRMAHKIGYSEGVAAITGNLADLALDQQRWSQGESLAREALPLSEAVGRQELIAEDCRRLAEALARQGRQEEALSYAQRAVEIFTRLRSPYLEQAKEVLLECSQ